MNPLSEFERPALTSCPLLIGPDPVRGRKADATGLDSDGLPAMGYLQVDGLCEQLPSGSRRNIAEAETIAAWIADRKAALEQSYPERTLSEVLGIVTPFKAQVEAIQEALSAVGINTEQGGGVTVGSVHAFQGAQRAGDDLLADLFETCRWQLH